MAWVIVGWKSPPYWEYAARWVGRVWPKEKNVDSALLDVRAGGRLGKVEVEVLVGEA